MIPFPNKIFRFHYSQRNMCFSMTVVLILLGSYNLDNEDTLDFLSDGPTNCA